MITFSEVVHLRTVVGIGINESGVLVTAGVCRSNLDETVLNCSILELGGGVVGHDWNRSGKTIY